MSWHLLNTCLPPHSRGAGGALDLIRHSWKSAAGPLLAERTAPVSLDRRGNLVLKAWGADTPALLAAMKKEMVKRVGAFLGDGIVSDIRWRMTAGTVEPSDPPPSFPAPEAEGLGKRISDPGLRDSFTAACRRILGRRPPSRR